MLKIEGILHHKAALELIGKVSRPRWGKFVKKSHAIDNTKVFFKPIGKGFSLSFQHESIARGGGKFKFGRYLNYVEFISKQESIVFGNLSLDEHAPPKVRGSVSLLYSKGYSKKKKYYYRVIIPLQEELHLFFKIENVFFATDIGYRSRTATQATINGDTITICVINNGRKNFFLSIESIVRQSFESFSKKAHAVINGLGFLTGYLVGDKGWYFAYDNKNMEIPTHFYFREDRDSIKSMYAPINSNPNSYLWYKKKVARKYNKLRTVKCSEFSILCQHLHNSTDFSYVILLILESSVASLLFRPGGYAIALETLSEYIIKNMRVNLSPIQDKVLSRKTVKECQDIITKNCSTILDKKTLGLLNSRISSNLNKPTNKAQLKAPFDALGIHLLEKDIEILETRNDLLHGRFPDITNEGSVRTDERINKDLYYVSVRLYTLLSMLILKMTGFENRVVNFPKLSEKHCKIKLKEDYYRKV